MDLTANIQAAYDLAPAHIRRLMNQSIFDKLVVIDDEIADHVLAEPFRQLLADDLPEALEKPSMAPREAQEEPVEELVGVGAENERTPGLFLTKGSISDSMVRSSRLPSTAC